ncbi:MAG: hypothetical protein NTW07_03415 [candidate division Zixibacteria bacterium]|nr:hypothetical protein [candidate division Zixibacteria bacterium]
MIVYVLRQPSFGAVLEVGDVVHVQPLPIGSQELRRLRNRMVGETGVPTAKPSFFSGGSNNSIVRVFPAFLHPTT